MTRPEARGGRLQLGSGAATSLPVYHQLHLILDQRIRDGSYPPGAQFPSETLLAEQHGVSRVSVRRALGLLERDGLIDRRRGAGTFVRARPGQHLHGAPGQVGNLITIGLKTEARLLLIAPDPAPPGYVIAATGWPTETVVRIERARTYRGTPFSCSTLYLRTESVALIEPATMGERPIVDLLETAGIVAGSAEQTLSATLADDRTGTLLDVPLGAPLVRLRRLVRDRAEVPILYQQSLYHPDRYEYHMLLTRDQTAGQPQWRQVD